jgi:hypothetical protein
MIFGLAPGPEMVMPRCLASAKGDRREIQTHPLDNQRVNIFRESFLHFFRANRGWIGGAFVLRGLSS